MAVNLWVSVRVDKLRVGQAGVPRGRGVNSVTSTWLGVFPRPLGLGRKRRSARRARSLRSTAETALAFFRAAMSIAKRIWPAILIDSKFSTKLHGTGLSPIFSDWKERFLLKSLAREREREREWVSRVWGLQQDFVWTDLRNNPWVLLAEVSTTLVLYQSI